MYEVPDQRGKIFVVTGANSGTGKETAARLAGAGADVVLAVRDLTKGEAARRDILQRHPEASLSLSRVDLAELASVREFAERLIAAGRPLDVLVNNAGLMMPPARMTTKDGFELQLGTNFLGPFALTVLLLPLILRAPAPRVATMSSGMAAYGRIHFDDLQYEHGRYGTTSAYCQSKLADLLMARRLADLAQEQGWKLRSTAAHPGYTRTNLQSAGSSLGRDKPRRSVMNLGIIPTQDVRTGAEPLLFAAADPGAVNGGYYGPKGLLGLVGPTAAAKVPSRGRDLDVARRLWAEAERLTGVSLTV
jgi:NAD(P)-dependent dehydrogenase (short-subunit alcohol dehydrogenase family)